MALTAEEIAKNLDRLRTIDEEDAAADTRIRQDRADLEAQKLTLAEYKLRSEAHHKAQNERNAERALLEQENSLP
jgi:hypothetical protein